MKKLFFITVLLLIGINAALKSQNISGTVYDTKYDKPVPDANVTLLYTGKGASADNTGNFLIKNVQPGKYTLQVSLVGYITLEKEIVVSEKGVSGIALYLQPSNVTLTNEFVVTARRIETDDFSSPEAITVLNTKSLAQESARSVPEALEGATGVFVQKTNHGGGSPFIRGFTGNQNLLMIDGIRLNNATYRYGPNQYLNTLTPQIIDKIEVVRGAGSVLYGSDALGGVVNLLTKAPSYSPDGLKIGGRVHGKWMSDDMQKTGRAEIGISGKKTAFSGGFTYNDFGNIVGGDTTGKQIPTGYQDYSGDMKFKWKITDNQELTLAWQYDKQTDVPRYDKIITNYTKYHFDPQIRQLGYARLKSNFSNKWYQEISTTVSFNQSDEQRMLQKSGSLKTTYEHDLVNTYGATIQINSKPGKNWYFVSGIEYYFDEVNSKTTEVENDISTKKRGYYPDGATSGSFAIYTSHTIDVKKFSFILGGRFNIYSIKANDVTFSNVDVNPSALVGSASVLYHLNQNYNLIGSIYSAFRAPNINDLSSFGTFNAGIEIPNPDLKPEKSVNAELGLKTKYEKFSGSIFIYQDWIKDQISRVEATYKGQDSLNGEKVFRKENFAKSFIHGIEADLQYELNNNFSTYGNITWIYGQNESAGEPMRRIPPLNGKLGIYYQNKSKFWSKLEWLAADEQDRLSSGDIKDSRIPEGGTPAWNVLNLRAGYSWKKLHFTAGLNNLFNEDYRTHGSGINGYGRSVWVAVSVGF